MASRPHGWRPAVGLGLFTLAVAASLRESPPATLARLLGGAGPQIASTRLGQASRSPSRHTLAEAPVPRPHDSVGMRRGVHITVAPYHPLWPEEFARVRAELADALPDWILSIDHVGSTSVPGLDAKPIIDVSVAVPDLEASLSLVPTFERMGFAYRPKDDLPDRHYFPRTVAGLRRHHVSVSEPDAWTRRNALVFRDALRRDPELAHRYSRLKQRLAASVGTDRLAYLNGKTDFILGVLRAEGHRPSPDYPLHYLERR